MTIFAYFIGGPADLSKQVLKEAVSIVNFAEILPLELNLHPASGEIVGASCVIYRKRGRLENQGSNEVWIYEAMKP